VSSVSERGYRSIGEVLALLQDEFPDVTISKIRFLESQGLIDPERTTSGYRKFFEDDVNRLRFILRQQREHFLPLKVIRDRLDAGGPDEPPGHFHGLATSTPTLPFDVDDRVGVGDVDEVAANGAAPDHDPFDDDLDEAPVRNGAATSTTRATSTTSSTTSAMLTAPSDERLPVWMRQAPPVRPSARDTEPGGVMQPLAAVGSLDALTTPVPPALTATAGSAATSASGSAATSASGSADAGAAGEPASNPNERAASAIGNAIEPRATAPPVAAPPAVGGQATSIAAAAAMLESSVSLTGDELLGASGLTWPELRELEGFGLLAGRNLGRLTYYDDEALAVARMAAAFKAHGIEARHLRMYKHFVDREADLFEQVVTPFLKQRNPQARAQAAETLRSLADHGATLRSVLMRRALRPNGGASE